MNRDDASTSVRSFFLRLCLRRPSSHVAYCLFACACVVRVNSLNSSTPAACQFFLEIQHRVSPTKAKLGRPSCFIQPLKHSTPWDRRIVRDEKPAEKLSRYRSHWKFTFRVMDTAQGSGHKQTTEPFGLSRRGTRIYSHPSGNHDIESSGDIAFFPARKLAINRLLSIVVDGRSRNHHLFTSQHQLYNFRLRHLP